MPDISINGIVSHRNKEPYVQVTLDGKMVLQLKMSEARKVAADLQLAASRAEVDAMILRFFNHAELPEQAAAALLVEFRDFRLGLDLDRPDGYISPPDENAPDPGPWPRPRG